MKGWVGSGFLVTTPWMISSSPSTSTILSPSLKGIIPPERVTRRRPSGSIFVTTRAISSRCAARMMGLPGAAGLSRTIRFPAGSVSAAKPISRIFSHRNAVIRPSRPGGEGMARSSASRAAVESIMRRGRCPQNAEWRSRCRWNWTARSLPRRRRHTRPRSCRP